MSAARISAGSAASESANACAVPWEAAWTVGGRSSLARVASMAVMASPRATPGAVLKESVTAGNCPWWEMDSGETVGVMWVKALSGTWSPATVFT